MSGSLQMLKASWDNFMSGTGDLGKVVESANVAFGQIMKIVNDALPDIMENFYDWLPELVELGGQMISTITSSIMENLPTLMSMARRNYKWFS